MVRFYRKKPHNYDYFKFPQKGFPKTIYWRIIAGSPKFKLNPLTDHDIVFDEHDLKIRQLI